jgi:hypothetical protein
MKNALPNHGIEQSAGYAAIVPKPPTGCAGRRITHPVFGMGNPAARDHRGVGRR